MRIPITLSKYIGKQFLFSLLVVSGIILFITIVFDFLELSRRVHNKDVPLGIMIQMVTLKLPLMWLEMLPFIVLISGILTFGKLTRYSELVVARSAGVSAWQFLFSSLCLSFFMGIVIIVVINPMSAIMLSRYELLESKYLRGGINTFALSSTGLWLKQDAPDHKGKIIIHALRAHFKESELYDVTFFVFDDAHDFQSRIFAPSVKLKQHHWFIEKGTLTTTGRPEKTSSLSQYEIPTTIATQQLQNSFSSPETIAFWNLPEFITTLKNAGLPTARYILHWHNILVTPFFLSAMVFFAAAFSLRIPRKGKTGLLVVGGVIAGFLVHFFSEMVFAIGLSGKVPLVFAAWAPALVGIFIGAALMLHLEDG